MKAQLFRSFAGLCAARVLSEQYSAARLTFNYLRRRAGTLPEARARAFEEFSVFAAI